MQWVKASERLPDNRHNYFVKVWSEHHQYQYNDCNYFDKGWSSMSSPKDRILEWLDEAPRLQEAAEWVSDAVEFCDWWDEMMLKKHQLRRLKDEPKWFWNNLPNQPEGKQSWMSVTTAELYQLFKDTRPAQTKQ